MSNESTEQRLMEIESKLAYQEDLMDSLNDIVTKQSEELASMQKSLKKLLGIVGNMLEGEGKQESDAQEVPPHY